MGLGFELAESMTGSFYRFDEPMKDYVMRITLRIGVDGLRRFARDRVMSAEGVILAEGLAENGGAGRTASGSLTWKLLDQNRVPYELAFEGDDARTYRLRGQRDFFVYNAIFSLTTLGASLYDDAGEEIGRALLHFEPRIEIPALVKSFRPRVRVKALSKARTLLKQKRSH
jgi:hypothetical protein